MEPFLGVSGQTTPCYPFYQRMLYCIKQEDMASRMCFAEIEDFYECKMRKKHRAFKNYMEQELSKVKIYSLPKYDFASDTFKDGPLPKDADQYFGLKKEEQTYYS